MIVVDDQEVFTLRRHRAKVPLFSGFDVLEQPLVENLFFGSPLTADFESRKLLRLEETVNGHLMNAEVLRNLFKGHDLGALGSFLLFGHNYSYGDVKTLTDKNSKS